MTAPETRMGGVVFRVGEELHFLPASVAVKVLPVPDVARVPGAPDDLVGVAIVDGETLPVVAVGNVRGAMLVLTFLGERVGLVGLEVLATGRFDADHAASAHGERVVWSGRVARLFDVAAAIARVRDGRWVV